MQVKMLSISKCHVNANWPSNQHDNVRVFLRYIPLDKDILYLGASLGAQQ